MCHSYDSYYANAALEGLREREPRSHDVEQPIAMPAIFTWVAVVTVAWCVLVVVINALV
jgi:hypothetical protein